MYTPLLIGGYAAALLLLLFGLRVIQGSTPGLRGARQVSLYILCVLGALFFFLLRLWFSPLLSVAGANILSLASAVFMYLAACDIQEARPHLRRWLIGICVAASLGQAWLTFEHRAIADRLLVHGAAMTLLFGASALVLCQGGNESLDLPRRGAAALMTLAAVYQSVWGIMGEIYPPGPDLMHLGVLQTGMSYLAVVVSCANAAGLMWLSLCVHRGDLHRIAQTDSLTGLLNRRAVEEILRREMPRCNRTGRTLGAMMIDIDHFKQINDTMGHRAGDDVLRRVAESLQQSTRISDVLARYGGEEFIVLLRDSSLEESQVVAERIRVGIATLSGLPGNTRLTVSIGVAINEPPEIPEEFLLRCDEAMYKAKRGGRNIIVVHPAALTEPAMAHQD